MATQAQIKEVEKNLREYRKKYLKKEFSDVDESATRIMVNSFLTDVLGYRELEEVKTEFRIRGEYADYVIQMNRKKHFVVEVKSIQIDLNNKHLRQSVNYAANEGIDWVILFNGRSIELYRVLFGKPIESKKVFEYDLQDLSLVKKASESIVNLSKKSVSKGELEEFWRRCTALAPESMAKFLYSEEVIRYLRRALKKSTGIYFDVTELEDALKGVISSQINVGLRMKK